MEEQKTNYESYLERFCETYHVESDTAKQLAVVREVKRYYEEGDI